MNKELLLEIGTEELPSAFIQPILQQMNTEATALFREYRLEHEDIKTYGTPRRLILWVQNLSDRQTETTDETLGPPCHIAFDPDGRPTKAAIGFAKSQGATVGSLVVRRTPKGEYVAALIRRKGLATRSILPRVFHEYLSSFSFPKSMRWNASGIRFARPIRWILALYEGNPVRFQYAGVTSGSKTYGHRFMRRHEVPKRRIGVNVEDFSSYVKALEENGVIIDQHRRREIIRRETERLAKLAGGRLVFDDSLLTHATFSVEWPHPLAARFDSAYLTLPKDVVVTAMKEHQGFFSIAGEDGTLLPNFIAVCNVECPDMTLIRQGHERVLAARLADARFYFDDDRSTPLETKVPLLRGVTFQERLGSLFDKAKRVEELSTLLANRWAPTLGHTCCRAAELCKADLVTGMVGEFPTLQGVMGREYARADGEPDEVATAIAEHYLPRFSGDSLPKSLAGAIVAIADKIDTIAGYFIVGHAPTGSQDPYALRRQALGVLQIVIHWERPLSLNAVILTALEKFRAALNFDEGKILQDILDFFRQRMESICTGEGYRSDLIRAVLERQPFDDAVGDLSRIKALHQWVRDPAFADLAATFKRVLNILPPPPLPSGVNPDLFQSHAERLLHEHLVHRGSDVEQTLDAQRYADALLALASFREPIDRFFNDVLVMAEESIIRSNRLALLRHVRDVFHTFADFSKVASPFPHDGEGKG